MSTPDVSIVIVSFNVRKLLLQCLASLDRGAPELNLQVIVVDNGSAPAFAASLASLPPSVIVLTQPKPGQAAARNAGITAASGDLLFFTDADCRVDAGWLLSGIEGFERTSAPILRGHSGAVVTTAASRAIEHSFRWREQWIVGQTVNVDLPKAKRFTLKIVTSTRCLHLLKC